MAKLNVNIGITVNDKTGDTLRTAFDKINQNFTELYTLTGGTSAALTELAQDYAAPLFNHASHVNITAAYDDANNKILLTGVAAQVQSNWTASSGLGVILNKPTLFSGSYTDLTSTPTIPAAAAWPVTNTAGASGPTLIAIGQNAGLTTQGSQAVAVGGYAGSANQGTLAVAVGSYAGGTDQGQWAVAVGRRAGEITQGAQTVAIGFEAGRTGQGTQAVAVGASAGLTTQGSYSVAVGLNAGLTTQGNAAVAVGHSAGLTSQGASAVAIGFYAGQTSQAANTIILNATGSAVNGVSAQTNSFYVAPIRTDATPGNVLFYNTTTKEVTYGTASRTIPGPYADDAAAAAASVALGSPYHKTGTGGQVFVRLT